MEKTYTLQEVIELQNQRKQIEQRLAVHQQRAVDKQKELQAILDKENVKSVEELSMLCSATNTKMQEYAKAEESNIAKMKECCDALDRLL